MHQKIRGVGRAEGGSVNGEGGWGAWVVPVVEVKGRTTGGGVDGVVMCELNGGEMQVPIVLEGVDIMAETGEHNLVGILRLPISLGVVGRGHVKSGMGQGGESGPEGRGEAWVTIRD